MNIYLDLFLTFSRIGVLTFGGGYSMLPMLRREVVEKKKWATEEELMDYYALAQCTPGVIAVNTATFVGYKEKKVPGAIFATLGVVFPSLVIILIIAAVLSQFMTEPIVIKALAGVRIAVCGMVVASVIKLVKKAAVDWLTMALFIVTFALVALLNASPVIVVIAAGAIGIAAGAFRSARKAKKAGKGGEK